MSLDICTKIGNLLIEEKIKDPGLMNGNAGIAIFFYNLAKKTSDKKYQNHADALIDEVYRKFNMNINFQDGIAGTGWCIEYLIQNCYCKGNTNEILKGIDTRIFKFLNEQSEIPFDLRQGLIGYLQYLIMRLKNKKNYKSDEAQINIELLKFIINKIDRKATSQFINLTRDFKLHILDDVYMLLWNLNNAFSLNIYNEKIINMFKQWETYLISYLPCLNINRLYLAIILLQTNRLLKSEKVIKHIDNLLYSIDINNLELEIDIDIQKMYNVQHGYLGFLLVLTISIQVFNSAYPNYQKLINFKNKVTNLYNNRLFNALNETKNTVNNIINTQYGLSDGLAGAGLLLLLKPNILTA